MNNNIDINQLMNNQQSNIPNKNEQNIDAEYFE